MPSTDAFMEMSDPDVWGETYDGQFGMSDKGRRLGAFEIAKFDFDVSTDEDSATKTAAAVAAAAAAAGTHGHGAVTPALGTATGRHKEVNKGKFSISKSIDKSSPDLFLSCLKKTKMNWGIVSIRESGEPYGSPFLVVEFQGLTVTSFKWDLTPGGSADEAASQETVGFEYETVLIKYSRQSRDGVHRPVKMKGWDFRKTDNQWQVSEIPGNQLQPGGVDQGD